MSSSVPPADLAGVYFRVPTLHDEPTGRLDLFADLRFHYDSILPGTIDSKTGAPFYIEDAGTWTLGYGFVQLRGTTDDSAKLKIISLKPKVRLKWEGIVFEREEPNQTLVRAPAVGSTEVGSTDSKEHVLAVRRSDPRAAFIRMLGVSHLSDDALKRGRETGTRLIQEALGGPSGECIVAYSDNLSGIVVMFVCLDSDVPSVEKKVDGMYKAVKDSIFRVKTEEKVAAPAQSPTQCSEAAPEKPASDPSPVPAAPHP